MKETAFITAVLILGAAICFFAYRGCSYQQGYDNAKCEMACGKNDYMITDTRCLCRVQEEKWVEHEIP